MRKGLVITVTLLVVLAFFPTSAEADTSGYVKFTPCLDYDGTYKLTIEIFGYYGYKVGPESTENGVYGYQARIRTNGGSWTTYDYGKYGLTLKMGGLPAGTKVEVELMDIYDFKSTVDFIPLKYKLYSITLQGSDIPPCFKKCEGTQLFKMYLLTRPDSYCLLISDVHPSVESQKALCFPGTDWVATNTVCDGWVCHNDCWDCDYLGFERMKFNDLMKIYQRRMGLSQ